MSEETPSVKFEFLDVNPQTGAKRYYIEAIHVTITGNRRKYTKEELVKAAPSLSNKPLNEDHDHTKWLPYPENRTLEMAFDFEKMGVVGKMEIVDTRINREIEEGKIWKLSIEQKPRHENCQCNKAEGCFCEQIGIEFKALALLHRDHFPGDPKTVIKAESLEETPLSEIVKCECQEKPASKLEAEEKKEVDSSLEKPNAEENQMAEPTANSTDEPKKESTTATPTPVVNFDFKPVVDALNEQFKNANQIMIEKLAEAIGIMQKAVKTESAPSPASKVNNDGKNAYFESTVAGPAKFFESIKSGDESGDGFYRWNLNKEEWIASLSKGVLRHNAMSTKAEAVSIGAGDKPQIFDKELLILPGGRMMTPLRQYFDTKVFTNADRINFYKGDVFDVDDTTAEGIEGTNKTNTITKVQAVPQLKRANQTVNYADIEDMAQDLVQYINVSCMIGALHVENKEVLTTTYGAITPTFWVRGDTGADLASGGTDDVSGIGGLDVDGIMAALELLETEGIDTTAGRCVLFAHPHAVRQLALNVASDFFTGDSAITQRDLAVIERRLGVDIVPTNTVKKTTGGSNANCYQNVLAVKGEALGLAVAANLQVEAQRRPDLSAVKIGARHRLKGVVKDEKRTVRISTTIS